jgi:hypothetical protein
MTAIARRGRGLLGLSAAIAVGIVLVLAGALVPRARESGHASTMDDQVVATIRTSGPAYSADLRNLLRSARAAPDDPAVAKAAARRLIDEGRKAGDTRLVGAALGLLRPFLDAPDAEILYLSATARQYQHDFTGALDLLDRALLLAPGDASALLARATINVVVGRLDAAEGDCRRLHGLPRPDLGFLCQSTALAPTAAAPTVYGRLEAILARPGLLDASLRAYALGLMGEIAALQGWPDLARADLAAALTQDPGDIRVRMLLADQLLAEHQDAETLNVLEPAPAVDGVLLLRAIAARQLGLTAAARKATTELSRRFRQNIDLGLTAHAREEARFYLQVENRPELALGRARINWSLQREVEDAQLLIDAAVAAGSPSAAAPVLAWIAEQSVAVPTLRVPDVVRVAAR